MPTGVPRGFKKKFVKVTALTLVRCLGPAGKDHYFKSPNPSRVRVCPRCRKRQESMSFSARQCSPCPFVGDPNYVALGD